jgi:Tol biopolymer transport system component
MPVLLTACSSGVTTPTALPSIHAATSTPPRASADGADSRTVGAGEPWITFQQFADKSRVMLVRTDGSGLHSPTSDVPGGDQTNPDWSPDGSQLVFAVSSGGSDVLWVVNADGTDARLLVDCDDECAVVDDPDWAPDGETVLFSRVATDPDGAMVATLEQVDVASGALTVLVQAEPGHFYAGQRWSPDGRAVVLEVVALGGPTLESNVEDVSLAIIDVSSPAPAGRELLGGSRFPETAAWAPDGSLIVFGALESAGSSAGTDLYAIAPDGSGLRRITNLAAKGGNATHPEVTADGASIVFTATLAASGAGVLAEVAIGGGALAPATGTEFVDGVHPRLRPHP